MVKIIQQIVLFSISFSLIFFYLEASDLKAQTSAFTYQGKLTDSNQASNSNYEMQFRLFDNPSVGQGAQQGSTLTFPTVQTVNGIFTVQLDFGPAVFASGSNLYLEISLRPAGNQNAFTTLAPRQQLTSAPYSVRSVNAAVADNAAKLGNIPAAQFVQTNDSRLSDPRAPTPGSSNYIQNTTTTQPAANFNVGGTGTADILNAKTQFNLNGNRILSMGGLGLNNLFAGLSAGELNGTGNNNSAFGVNSGKFLNAGSSNSFFGEGSGYSTGSGNRNSFFGQLSGVNNLSGGDNSFFGFSSGVNSTGDGNSFFGSSSGLANLAGSNNTLIGAGTDVSVGNLTNATAIGAGATVSTSNTIVLGRVSGQDTVVIPGNLSVNGVILKAPNSTCWRLTVNNSGTIVSTATVCP